MGAKLTKNGRVTTLTVNNQTRPLTEWARLMSIQAVTIHARLRRGWSARDAVFLPVPAAPKSLIGRLIGKWTVLARGNKSGRWLCRCECGQSKQVNGHDMLVGKSKGCRSCARKGSGSPTFSHGMTKSSDYKSWASMLSRCNISSASGFENYGGRGIRVCRPSPRAASNSSPEHENLELTEWSKMSGVHPTTIRGRLRRGVTPSEAVFGK